MAERGRFAPTERSSPLPGREAVLLLRRVAATLPAEAEPWLVGGFLRDLLLGRESRDLDLAVGGDALSLARSLADALNGAFVPLDEPHQIARVVVEQEGETWHIDLAKLQGEVRQDLARRDFTIDAMAVPLGRLHGNDWLADIVDPFGGRADLERRVVRAVTPGVFREDGARLLRAVRLAAYLDFRLEEQTGALIRSDADRLDGVSGERVRDELLQVLSYDGAGSSVALLDRLGLLSRVLPELDSGRGVTQPKEHAWDVFTHNVQTVGAVEGLLGRRWDPSWVLEEVLWNEELEGYFRRAASDGHTRATLMKLAGLLHDVAKPATRTVDPSGRIRFKGHHSQGAQVVRSALGRLRLSGRGIQLVEGMVRWHLRPGQMSPEGELATVRAVYRYFRDAAEVAVDTLYLNLADYLAARGPLLDRQEWVDYARKVRSILETGLAQRATEREHRLATGDDLMAVLRLPPGPLIGQLLGAIQEAQAAGEVTSREEALELASRLVVAREPRRTHA